MPYFSFRLTHLRHHKTVGQLELEEVYVPHRRPDYGLPPAHEAKEEHYMEAFAESPAFLLLRFLVMQFLGLRASDFNRSVTETLILIFAGI